MQPRTRRQKEVFDYLKYYVEKFGCTPSYQMIANKLGLASKAGIAKHIESLERQGLLTRRQENGCFAIEFRMTETAIESICEIEWLDVPQSDDYVSEFSKEKLFVPKFMIGYHDAETLRGFLVPNDAMLEKHICEGDVALIEKRSHARDKDIVIAVTEKKRVVMKQFFRDGAKIELRPANPNYQTIVVAADKVKLLGVMRGILRPLS